MAGAVKIQLTGHSLFVGIPIQQLLNLYKENKLSTPPTPDALVQLMLNLSVDALFERTDGFYCFLKPGQGIAIPSGYVIAEFACSHEEVGSVFSYPLFWKSDLTSAHIEHIRPFFEMAWSACCHPGMKEQELKLKDNCVLSS